jgi:hypothetical protein
LFCVYQGIEWFCGPCFLFFVVGSVCVFVSRTYMVFLCLAGCFSSMHVLVLFKVLRHELTKSCHDERGVFSFNSHGHVFVHG